MSAKIDIRESERGVVRVFLLDLPAQAIERFTVQAGTGEWPLKYGLGASHLNAHFIDVVDLRDLSGMTLSAYLAEGYAIPKANLREAEAQLNALKGHVVIVSSRAFDNRAQTLTVQTPLRWVGTFEEQKGRTITPPLRSKSAKGSGQRSTPDTGAQKKAILRALMVGLAVIVAFAAVSILRTL